LRIQPGFVAPELLRAMLPFPDLLDQESAMRKSLARESADRRPVFARTKSANQQISPENAGGGTEQVADKPSGSREGLGRDNTVAIFKSGWLRNAGREHCELLLMGEYYSRQWTIVSG